MSGTEDRIREEEERVRRRVEGAAHARSPALEEYRRRWAVLVREIETRLGGAGGAGGAAPRPEAVGPRERLMLERALSLLKHGAVESCLFNLNLLAQMHARAPEPETLARLRRSAERLPELRQEVQRFLAQPLAAGTSFGDALPELQESLEGTLRQIESALAGLPESAARVPALVTQALDCIARAGDRLRAQRVSLRALAQGVLEDERPRLEQAGVETELAAGSEEDGIHADPAGVRDVLTEVLRNAAEHRVPGARGRLRMRLRAENGFLCLEASNWPALPPLCQPEQLLQGGASRRGPACGRGLPRIREVLAALGGRVRVSYAPESRTFSVELGFPLKAPL